MFYSHNLLARKGPLGTVWCAAHLQNRLKKSNYITINIPSTVEQIMNPQVPIALRMSGHLLLGVVRIYSKKVEYLQHDYNALSIDISKAYTYADINLPQDANQAKFESITLPDNFALDLMDIDDYNPNGSPDSHLRPNEEISFADRTPISISKRKDHQTPAGYIRISVGEDVFRTPSPSGDNTRPVTTPVEENRQSPDPHTPPPMMDVFREPDPTPNAIPQMGYSDSFINEDNIASAEFGREPNASMTPHGLRDMVEPDQELFELFSKEKTKDSAKLDEIVINDKPVSPPKTTPPHEEPTHSDPEPHQDISDLHVSFGLAPSPAVELAPVDDQQAPVDDQLRVKRRRIKYDKATVLTNEFMKKAIDDPSGLLRKRKGACSFLDVWKLKNCHKKERVVFEPVITGLSNDLCQMLENGYVLTKPHLINSEGAPSDPSENEPDPINTEAAPSDPTENEPVPINTEQAPSDRTDVTRPADNVDPDNNDDALENPRRADIVDSDDMQIDFPDNGSFPSPRSVEENTPSINTDVGSKSYQFQTTAGTGVTSTSGLTSSIGSFVSEKETPFGFSQSHQGFEYSGGLSDIAEVDDVGELPFLEDDEIAGLRGTPDTDYSSGKQRPPPESGSLLPRTRAVAQYIKDKSTATPSSSEHAGSVSMKSILEGKSRKVCSRMFFETLVLKSCDLIDVKQDVPYGDITLKVTPKLSKLQFSD